MFPLILIAILGGILFPALLYYTEIREKRAAALIVKTVSSLTFVVLGRLCGMHSSLPEFARIFWIGEILGAVGDVVINLGPWFKGSKVPFCLGGTAFLAGHVLYIVALRGVNPDGLGLSLALTAAVFAGVFVLLLKFTETDRVMRILTTLYMGVVSAFFAFTLAAFLAVPSAERGSLVFGALVFLFSDFDLMLQTMGKKKWGFVFPCMYTYYPAQIMIALCLYWFR